MASKAGKRRSGNPAAGKASGARNRQGAPAGSSGKRVGSSASRSGGHPGPVFGQPAPGPPRPPARDRKTRSGGDKVRRHDPAAGILTLQADEMRTPRGCSSVFEGVDPQGLAATYEFPAPDSGGTFAAAVRFRGVRKDVDGELATGDQFDRTERLEDLPATGGPVSLTARVQPVNAGHWRVVAEPVELDWPGSSPPRRRVVDTSTTFGLLAQGPNVRLFAWPSLIGLGAVVAIVLQLLLASAAGLGVVAVLALSLLGCLLGFAGGKLWYLGLHRRPLRDFLNAGACIQGFLLVCLGVLTLGSLLLSLPVGTVLDVTTPGVFLAVAIGRPGCFLTGCCAGRPTASRWGLVSSDRRLTVRRYPVQLLEAGLGLGIGLVTLAVVLLVDPPVPGAVFVGAIAAYTMGRQLLFPLRMEPRTRRGRMVTMAACAVVLATAVATFLT